MSRPGGQALPARAEITRLCQTNEFAKALPLCAALCAKQPNDPELWFLLGAIQGALGDYPGAEVSCRRAVALAPSHPLLHQNLGIALLRQGRADTAQESFERALKLDPASAQALTGIGDCLFQLGRFDDAVQHYRRSTALSHAQPQAWHNLALASVQTGDAATAESAFAKATALAPAMEAAWLGWSRFLQDRGRREHAAAVLDQAIARCPGSPELHYQIGAARHQAGRSAEAMTSFEACLRLMPGHRDAAFARAMLLRQLGRHAEAAQVLHMLLEGDPDDARAHAGLAGLYKDEGRIEASLSSGCRAVELDPRNTEFRSNWIMNMHYSDRVAPADLFEAHREWGLRHANAVVSPLRPIGACDPGQPLRIGYLSPDFREHSVARFIAPVLKHHDHQQFTIFCYSNLPATRADSTTKRLRERADVWREIAAMPEEGVRDLIGADGVDILIDLAGHSAGNRLGVFALRAAPIQMTWIGYPGTTGVPAIDYRLTDAIADPEADGDRYYTERLLRIDGGFLCFDPPLRSPDPGPAPSAQNGFVTFGSFNNLAKLSDSVLTAWVEILRRKPGSRLILKSHALGDTAVRDRVRARFSTQGLDTERIELLPWLPGAGEHLAAYQRIDIALDTFPYNGTTTTCEALWMGVPVVTLRGSLHAGRVGASLLDPLMPGLIADSPAQYVETAVALAGDPARLRALRDSLRGRMQDATLTGGEFFTRRVEQCYREAWRRLCKTDIHESP